ncbi:hypothetical protein J7T55_001146 [Diaporthe amygdali]|uniref:uncharacterized protein n=1 Tax=Phomopsis amygdali TaxID=1214568 RepID=UPI0022FDF6D8|nr:uncharacterized protein J7T55_001146 [Diaporthe amygdali]KAJ0120288.1 hypothetical protein J7T55_001146 [Diaporthe amygdali]
MGSSHSDIAALVQSSTAWIIGAFLLLILVVVALSIGLRMLYVRKWKPRYEMVQDPARDVEAGGAQSRQRKLSEIDTSYAPSTPAPATVVMRPSVDEGEIARSEALHGYYEPPSEVTYNSAPGSGEDRKTMFS